MFVSHKLQ